MIAAVKVSNFAWPYGWPRSADRAAKVMPTSATTFETPSKRELMPSACMAAESLKRP